MRIYVGNLSYDTSEEQINTLFAGHGEVASASLITDKHTGRSKGFAFVEMANADQAKAVIAELNGKDLDGRAITVNEARERQDSGSRGGYGGGGNRGGGGYGGGGGNRGGGGGGYGGGGGGRY